MPTEEQWAIIESVDATLSAAGKIRGILKLLLRSTDAFLRNAKDGILSDLGRHEYDCLGKESWYRKKDAFDAELLGRMEELYRTVEDSPLLNAEAVPTSVSRKKQLDRMVSAAMIEGMLVVKTPHLLNRNVTRHGGKGRLFEVDYHSFFAPEVERALNVSAGAIL